MTLGGEELTDAVKVGEGSGFAFQAGNGASLILTNAHVILQTRDDGRLRRDRNGNVMRFDHIDVVTHDGQRHMAIPIGIDTNTDLAVLRVDTVELPTITWADSDQVLVGDWVLALGYPFEVGYSATSGIISATDRSNRVYRGQNGIESFLQTDAAINPGNSGGPLVDMRGRVAGVNANIISPGRVNANVGIGFAIPANLARRVAEDLADDGEVDWPVIGVKFEQPTPNQLAEVGVPNTKGVLVTLVLAQSPAAQAGLQAGDVIIAIADKQVQGWQQFRAKLAASRVGDVIPFTVWRRGVIYNIDVQPISARDLDALLDGTQDPPLPFPQFGLTAIAGTDDTGNRPQVIDLLRGGPAANAGLRVGDLIVAVDGIGTIRSLADLRAAQRAVVLPLTIWRDGKTSTVILRSRRGR